ncbi:hypothetical protein ACFLY2_03265 [Patescibacteria group bacterium]
MINIKIKNNEYSIDGEFLITPDPSSLLNVNDIESPLLSNPIISEIQKDGVDIKRDSEKWNTVVKAVEKFLKKDEYFKYDEFPQINGIDLDNVE